MKRGVPESPLSAGKKTISEKKNNLWLPKPTLQGKGRAVSVGWGSLVRAWCGPGSLAPLRAGGGQPR